MAEITLPEVVEQLNALTEIVNGITTQSKNITDLDAQSPLVATSEIPVSNAGADEKITASQLLKFVDGTSSADANYTGGNVGIGTATPTTAFQMGDDKLISLDVNATITASTSQSQGNGSLSAQINEVSVVVNPNDTVTLPLAITGIEITIINKGANILQIFPASGDDLGLGTDNPTTIEPNKSVEYLAYDDDTWFQESAATDFHSEMGDEDNTDPFVINDAGGDFHSYHTNGMVPGDLDGFTFDAGGSGTSFPIASVADGIDTGNDIEVTTTGSHGLAVDDIVSQTNLSDAAYVGVFIVKAIISATQYEVAASFTSTGTGTMDQAATLTPDINAEGHYFISWAASATSVTNNETFDFRLYENDTVIPRTKSRRKFGTSSDFGSFSGIGTVHLIGGEKLSFALSNEDSASNIIIRNLNIILTRI